MTTSPAPRGAGRAPRLTPRAKWITALGALAFVAVAFVITGLRGSVEVGSQDMLMDPNFRIPAPPRDMEWWSTGTYISLIIAGLADLTLIILGIRDYVRTKSLIPLCLGMSALAFVVPEVFVDILGGVYMVADPHMQVFTILGRDMGLFIFVGWMSYGFVPYAMYKLLTTRPKTKALWVMLLVAGVANVVNEEWLLLFKAYHYYGNQPLVLGHLLPWWWIPCNAVGSLLAASVAYRYRHLLRGWRAVALFVTSPLCLMGVYGLIAMPGFIAVNGAYPWWVTQILGLAVFALGILVFMAVQHLILQRHPLDFQYVPPEEEDGDRPAVADGRGSARETSGLMS